MATKKDCERAAKMAVGLTTRGRGSLAYSLVFTYMPNREHPWRTKFCGEIKKIIRKPDVGLRDPGEFEVDFTGGCTNSIVDLPENYPPNIMSGDKLWFDV